MELTPQEKIDLVSEIIKSETFKSSSSCRRVLQYLLECNIENKSPKEIDLAIDLFNRSHNFNTAEDTIVRVSVHNARKRLELYYNSEGKHHTTRVAIDRGQYKISFEKRKKDTILKPLFTLTKIQKIIFVFMTSLIIVLFLFIFTTWDSLDNHHGNIRSSIVWSDLINARHDKLIVIGEEFFYREIDSDIYSETEPYDVKNETIIRRHHLNSLADLNNYKLSLNDSLLRITLPYSYFPTMNVWQLKKIIPLLLPKSQLLFQSSSNLTADQLVKNDVIFVGSFRSMESINKIVTDKIITANQKYLEIISKDTSITYNFKGEPGEEHNDFGYLRKIPGPNGTFILLILSSYQAGMDGLVDFITSEDQLELLRNELIKKYGEIPKYYDATFRISGHSRTALHTELIDIQKNDINNFTR